MLLSPGPGTPDRAGIMPKLITTYADSLPIFGVCLGHQGIGEAFGAVVNRAPELLHGKTSEVTHSGAGVLAGLPDPFTATRYHSLAVVESTLPDEFEVTGRTADSGLVMAMRHRTLPLEGVQFHPESVLTQGGHLHAGQLAGQLRLPRRAGPGPGAGGRGRGPPGRRLRLTARRRAPRPPRS